MSNADNFTNFTNSEFLNGAYDLTFEESCEAPFKMFMNAEIPQKPWLDGPFVKIYLDPDGLDFENIICSTRVRTASIRGCRLHFPHILTRRRGEPLPDGEWRTFRCTEFKEIFRKCHRYGTRRF